MSVQPPTQIDCGHNSQAACRSSAFLFSMLRTFNSTFLLCSASPLHSPSTSAVARPTTPLHTSRPLHFVCIRILRFRSPFDATPRQHLPNDIGPPHSQRS